MQTPIYEILTSISTTAAVLVALLAIFWPSILKYFNRPILVIEFENSEPFSRKTYATKNIATGQIISGNSYHLRLRIKNKGNSVARNCKSKLVAISHKDLKSLRKDFDPVNLHWVGSDDVTINADKDGKRSVTFNKNLLLDINAKDYEYVDLISISENSNKYEIQAIDFDIPRGIVLDPQIDDYYLLITIYSENCNPIHKVLKVIKSINYDEIKLEFVTKEETKKLFTLLK